MDIQDAFFTYHYLLKYFFRHLDIAAEPIVINYKNHPVESIPFYLRDQPLIIQPSQYSFYTFVRAKGDTTVIAQKPRAWHWDMSGKSLPSWANLSWQPCTKIKRSKPMTLHTTQLPCNKWWWQERKKISIVYIVYKPSLLLPCSWQIAISWIFLFLSMLKISISSMKSRINWNSAHENVNSLIHPLACYTDNFFSEELDSCCLCELSFPRSPSRFI